MPEHCQLQRGFGVIIPVHPQIVDDGLHPMDAVRIPVTVLPIRVRKMYMQLIYTRRVMNIRHNLVFLDPCAFFYGFHAFTQHVYQHRDVSSSEVSERSEPSFSDDGEPVQYLHPRPPSILPYMSRVVSFTMAYPPTLECPPVSVDAFSIGEQDKITCMRDHLVFFLSPRDDVVYPLFTSSAQFLFHELLHVRGLE